MAPHHLYTEHAETIESVLAYTRRTQRLTPDDGDEFASWARLKLLEDDCAILRKFQGLSTFRTFIVTVIQRLFLDWRIAEWGKWRPSADARRAGAVAVELEKLVLRDRLEFDHAVETLVSKGVARSRQECDEVWAELPRRPWRQRVGDEELDAAPVRAPQRDVIAEEEQHAGATRARTALAEAIPRLEPQEQLIIRLRFQDGFTIPRIAALLSTEAKPLYRRIEQILGRLRTMLTDAGVGADDMRGLLGNPALEPVAVFPDEGAGKLEIRPSTPSSTGRTA